MHRRVCGMKPHSGQGACTGHRASLRQLLSRQSSKFASFPQSPLASNDLNETIQTCSMQTKDTAVDVRLWKKKHAQARVRREYRTADEVLAEAAEKPQAAPKQTIIDMRGPQVLNFALLSCNSSMTRS